ncbi:MAG: hypothetical protein ACP5OS_09595, partial [Leptospirillia bacterium]
PSPRPPGLFPPDPRSARTVDKDHGRLEIREIRLFDPSVADYIRKELRFPHVRQAFKITRTVTNTLRNTTSVETVTGIGSQLQSPLRPPVSSPTTAITGA